jgi:aminocarboxymuconate-semialdehyde decarboxylase
MVIDVHNHIILESYVKELERNGSAYAARVVGQPGGDRYILTDSGLKCPIDEISVDMHRRLNDMGAAGIDRYCVSISPCLMGYETKPSTGERIARTINDGMAALAEAYPDHVLPMGTLPIQDLDLAGRELDRITNELRFRTIILGTHLGASHLGDQQFFPLWERIEASGVLVFFHPIPTVAAAPRLGAYHLTNLIGNPLETTITVASLIVGGVLDRIPGLKIVLPHAGGYVPWIRGRWRHGQLVREEAKVNITRPIDQYLRMLYFDSLTHSPAALEFLVDTLGPDRVVLGTDYFADMGDWQQVPVIRNLPGLTDAERSLILSGNVERLIGA